MSEKQREKLEKIKLLVLDVDGVLTDGTLIINPDGRESKAFNTFDGHGIRMWQRAGMQTALLSGRFSEPTAIRAKQLDIEHVIQDCHNKLPAFKALIEELNLLPENAAYIGDDLPDLPSIRYAGLGATVANAPDVIKKYADFVTPSSGGCGAVRELIEYILKNTDKWQELMQRYLLQD